MKPVAFLLLIATTLAGRADTFTIGPAMALTRTFHTATLLQDGRVLLAGGHATDPACELFDPATGVLRRTASMSFPRYAPSATLLADGRVLVSGGRVSSDPRGLPFGTYGDNTSEIFDPKTETFSAGPAMTAFRYAHASTRMNDGRVLVTGGGSGYVGGFSYSVHPHRRVDVYDSTTSVFSAAPEMSGPRWFHTATALLDGRVLVVGSEWPVISTAELYSADGTTTVPVAGAAPRSQHSATRLRDGRVLIAGGRAEDGSERRDLELYDPLANAIVPFGFARAGGASHAATLLDDGRVLLTGGNENHLAIAAADLLDPSTGVVKPASDMNRPRRGHQATLLPNSDVLVSGGGTNTTEIFRPGRGRRRAVR